jgi:hypothetical protein
MAKRVFFSFHYQDVADFRANVVRNHNVTKDDHGGYFDASIWEEAKKKGDTALKKLIHDGLSNTSVTCVLIGSNTYERPWVRYEIIRSLNKGNSLFSIHINGIEGKDKKTKINGPNPCDYLALSYSNDGTRLIPYEYKNGKWIQYDKHDGWTLKTIANKSLWGQTKKLKELGYQVYDWVKDDGYNNFKTWVG